MEIIEFLKLTITWILTWVITYFFTKQSLRTQFNHKLIENLYEKRFQTYTKLLEITQNLGKKETSFEEHKKARLELIQWQKTSGWFLLFTEETLDSFNEMKALLKKDKSIKDGYTNDFKKKIFFCRNKFRGCLRKEFNFLHLAEKSL